jgi:hypothetical protein
MPMMWKLNAAAVLLLPALFVSGQSGTGSAPQHKSAFEIHREHAVEINELAGHLNSQDDARRLVGMIADIFSDDLPHGIPIGRFLDRVAAAEYDAAQNPARRIPEQAIADAWNTFAREINAPPEGIVTAAEIHAMREGMFWSARMMWLPGRETIWTVPNFYATPPNGSLDENCRMLEAYDIVWQLANHYENLQGARERLAKGITLADMEAAARQTQGHREYGRVAISISPPDPIAIAEMRYVREHGELKMFQAAQKLTLDLLQAQNER